LEQVEREQHHLTTIQKAQTAYLEASLPRVAVEAQEPMDSLVDRAVVDTMQPAVLAQLIRALLVALAHQETLPAVVVVLVL
jgi:hypothetical protein